MPSNVNVPPQVRVQPIISVPEPHLPPTSTIKGKPPKQRYTKAMRGYQRPGRPTRSSY